ncbi:MAG: UrcA family protein [Sphingomonas sp.]|nr:UrcA family protein [Sphingomonas sp.]
MKQTLKIIAFSALATAAVIKAVPALAEPAPAQNVSIVHTSDLDLGSKWGRAVLDHRLVTAAFEVCGTASNVDLAGQNKVRACRADVLAKARAEGGQLASRGAPITVASGQ